MVFATLCEKCINKLTKKYNSQTCTVSFLKFVAPVAIAEH